MMSSCPEPSHASVVAQPGGPEKDVDSEAPAVVSEGDRSKLFLWFFLLVLVFSMYLFYQVLEPFVDSIIMASILSALCYPFYCRCMSWTKGRKVVSALLVLGTVTLGVALPLTFFIVELIPQAIGSIASVNSWLEGNHLGELLTTHVNPVIVWLDVHFPEVDLQSIDLRGSIVDVSRKSGQFLLSYGTSFVGNLLKVFMHFVLILLIMFYLLQNGKKMLKSIEYLFPMKPRQTVVVIESMRRMARSVFVGGLLVAALQGIVGGIGLAFVGIPALFWGTVMAVAALVPVVGTGLIWVPATLFLFVTGSTGKALFLLIWSAGVVCSIDTVLRPFFLREGSKAPVLFLFLSILGGVQAFGMLGILYGPMVLGLAAIMITLYSEEYHAILSTRGRE